MCIVWNSPVAVPGYIASTLIADSIFYVVPAVRSHVLILFYFVFSNRVKFDLGHRQNSTNEDMQLSAKASYITRPGIKLTD